MHRRIILGSVHHTSLIGLRPIITILFVQGAAAGGLCTLGTLTLSSLPDVNHPILLVFQTEGRLSIRMAV